jgi:FAD/FMN-containing dehydrogenase
MTASMVPDGMRDSFTGALIEPGDVRYDEARRVHNGLIDKRPALVACCASTADVVDALRVARERDLPIAVRGGGHTVAGKATIDDGGVIDVGPMMGAHVDPGAGLANAQAGLRWREYDRATAVYGVASTGGTVSTTGIAGLTLGGGVGYLAPSQGLSCDVVDAVEVVLATGDVVSATADSHPDLYWALRGGGGNFGIATSFRYRVTPTTNVLGGIVAYDYGRAANTLTEFADICAGASDDFAVVCGLLHAPDGSGVKLTALPMCHRGDLEDAEAETKPARMLGNTLLDTLAPVPYAVVNRMTDASFPRGALHYWKTAYLADLTPDAISAVVAAYDDVPSAMSCIVIEYLHGAATRVAPDATAFPHRAPGFSVLVLGQWTDPRDNDANIGWTRDTFDALRPFARPGHYVNYLSADDGGLVRDAYTTNWERLVSIKRRYDPDNIFRGNQNIDPKTAEAHAENAIVGRGLRPVPLDARTDFWPSGED